MATITVRIIPEEVITMIKNRARRNKRSMEQEIRTILSEVVLDREQSNLLTYDRLLLTVFPTTAKRPDQARID